MLALKVIRRLTTKISGRDGHLVETGRRAQSDCHILPSGCCGQGERVSEVKEAVAQHLKIFD